MVSILWDIYLRCLQLLCSNVNIDYCQQDIGDMRVEGVQIIGRFITTFSHPYTPNLQKGWNLLPQREQLSRTVPTGKSN